ncbi:MAG: hypothetical protein PVJ71_03810 [Lysobacterales bacterium]|jgi:hypothetical protein
MSVLYAIDHTGLASLFGWFGFGVGTLAVFHSHTWKFEAAEKFSGPLGGWAFKVAFLVMVSVQLVMITDKAGAW